jgi:hypothetical protein
MFSTYFNRLLDALASESDATSFNKICNGAYDDGYKGKDQCAHNIALSFLHAKRFLEKEISTKTADWKWKYVHVNEYSNPPWSMTALKPIWHREVPIGGNGNTP